MVSKKIVLMFLSLFLINVVMALPVYVKPLDGSGNVQANTTFHYEFNFTTDNACATVVFTNRSNITTGSDGIGFIDINISGISPAPSYLCEYKNGTLRATHLFSDQIFKDVSARDVNVSGNIGEEV